jgi:hypothetical protein
MSENRELWEFCRDDEILGLLSNTGWGRPPWIDCHFAGKRQPHRAPYFALFHRYTLVKKDLGYNAWVAGGIIPLDPSESVDRNKLEKERVELLQTIQSLQFSLIPVVGARSGKVIVIYAHGRHIMVITDFSALAVDKLAT